MLPRILDGRLVGALAPEIVAEVERSDDLIEEPRITFGRFGHSDVRTGRNLPYVPDGERAGGRGGAGRAKRFPRPLPVCPLPSRFYPAVLSLPRQSFSISAKKLD